MMDGLISFILDTFKDMPLQFYFLIPREQHCHH
jgi:hypothetical protein